MSNLVKVDLGNGKTGNVIKGSKAHQSYLDKGYSTSSISFAQNAQAQRANPVQQTPQQSYSQPAPQQQQSYTPPTTSYVNSGNVKSLDNNGQSNFSVSGYQGVTTPSFTASQGTQQLLDSLRNQESLANTTWNTPGQVNYNDIWKERNNLSGQLLNALMQDSGGKASLAEIESIFGRRVENQELENYRNTYNDGNVLQQGQLNNLWEHDFATRNNGEHYQYVQNYLGGDQNAPLAETMKQYLDGLGTDGQSKYATDMANSLKSTQDYFNQRGTGWTPEYVNNTINPAPWGPVDAGDVINDGGVKLKEAMEYYLKYGLSPYEPNPELEMQMLGGQQGFGQQQFDPYAQMMQQMQAQALAEQQALEAKLKEIEEQNAYKQSQGAVGGGGASVPQTGNTQHIYNPGQTAGGIGYTDSKVVDNQVLTKYLESILKGGF